MFVVICTIKFPGRPDTSISVYGPFINRSDAESLAADCREQYLVASATVEPVVADHKWSADYSLSAPVPR